MRKMRNCSKQEAKNWRIRNSVWSVSCVIALFLPSMASSQTTMSLKITQPTAKAIFEPNTTVKFTANVSGGPGVDRVVFRVDGKKICKDTEAPYECSYTTPNEAKDYKLRVRAVDINKNGISRWRTFTVSTGNPPPDFEPRDYARVFISGHSLTDMIPFGLMDIAGKNGDNYNSNHQSILGSPIRVRTKGDYNVPGWPGYSQGANRNGNGMNVINELLNPQTIGSGAIYDTLILTERNDLPEVIIWEDTIGFARHYHDRLTDGNSTARTLLYHAWLAINKDSPSVWMKYETDALVAWECVASKMNLSLQAEGRAQRVKVLPAGAALVQLVDKALKNEIPGISGSTREKMNLIFIDDVHVTQLGSYFVSLVSYSSVMGKSAVGIAPPAGISSATATALQNLAWDYVRNYYNSPNVGVRTMNECKTQMLEKVCDGFADVANLTDHKRTMCKLHFDSDHNDFQWPDPNWTPYPPPAQ